MCACAQVDPSRRICDAVAAGELDVAIIGGDLPAELVDILAATPYAQARTRKKLCFLLNKDINPEKTLICAPLPLPAGQRRDT